MRFFLCLCFVVLFGCNNQTPNQVVSRAGVHETVASISTGSDGLTVEQRNIKSRIQLDNKPGSIKHLYVLSAYSGQAIFYSTVNGKVTSSGKRLSPYQTQKRHDSGGPNWAWLNVEALQDDGTYGNSAEYIYWFDQRGVYHQHYISGGQILHISTEPIPIKSVIVNVETTAHEETK